MKIFIVENDPYTQKIFQAILANQGHTVLFSSAGRTGLLASKQLAPDLIVLDIPFSDTDGVQFLQKLRKVPETETVPVIILLSKSQENMENKYVTAGASTCLNKPFRPWQLLAQIEDLSS
ncbi:MAG: hypothetical protein DRJ13_06800 [Bacteroidetes bacterium]|nr:MAG: hypothetical protein DRJ13_06800 [Bacteroidota bacterium]